MSEKLKGIGIGSGISIAKAFLLEEPKFEYLENSSLDPKKEKELFLSTISKVVDQIKILIKESTKNISKEKGEIFRAHLEMINDEQIQEEIKKLIESGKSQAWSINEIFNKYIKTFEEMDNDYFKERSSDLRDIKKRLLACACGEDLPDLLLISEECIIIANDLSPSETAMLNKKYIKGFATNIGGATSHSAIMARTLEIPAVVSLKQATSSIKNGNLVALDAKEGIVEFNLNDKEQEEWKNKQKNYEKEKQELEKYRNEECKTKDGKHISIKGNIGQPRDLKKVIEYGGKGIGLFRSEFLYMENQDWPTEEEQFIAYKTVLEESMGHEITIRTLDIGGDKHLNYFKFPEEMNPFLGYRALRLSLDKRDIFRTQIRALLRASSFGKLKIMFPMVTTLDEFIEAKKFTKEVEKEIKKEGYKVSEDYKIGMMIEIPSTAILAKSFAKESEFFSIGSNDLIQYTHAVDRMSEEVNYLYQPNNPSILNLIKMSIIGAKTQSREISVCGEMASNSISAILLIGMGIDCLSMSATAIPGIKKTLSQISMSECKMLADTSLNLGTEKEVIDYVKDYLNSKSISF